VTKYPCLQLGHYVRQKGLYDYDNVLKRSTSLLALWLLPKTISTYTLEESKVFYLPMQKVCTAVCRCQSVHHLANVHHISQRAECCTRLELCISRSQYLSFCFIVCELDSRNFCFLFSLLSRTFLPCLASTFESLLCSFEIPYHQNHDFLYFLAENSYYYVRVGYDEVFWP